MRWWPEGAAAALVAALAVLPAQADRPQWAFGHFPFGQVMNLDAVYEVTHSPPPQLLATLARWGVDVRRVPGLPPGRQPNPHLAALPVADPELLRRAGFDEGFEGRLVCRGASCCGLARDTILIREHASDYTLIHEFVQSLLRPECPGEPDDVLELRFATAYRRLVVYQRRLYDDPFRLLDPRWRRDIHAAQHDVVATLHDRLRLGQSQEAIVEKLLSRYIDERSPCFDARRRAEGLRYGQQMIDSAIDVFNAVHDSSVFVTDTVANLARSLQQGELTLEPGLALGDADVAEARRVAQAVQAQLAPVRAELEGLKRFYGR